jgi:hypothetical protein
VFPFVGVIAPADVCAGGRLLLLKKKLFSFVALCFICLVMTMS